MNIYIYIYTLYANQLLYQGSPSTTSADSARLWQDAKKQLEEAGAKADIE